MLSSAAIKHINALKIKKYRCKYGEFVAEGPKLVSELLHNNFEIKQLYYVSELQHIYSSLSYAVEVSDDILNKLSHLHSHHYKVLAVCAMPNFVLPEKLEKHHWYMALDDIQDPGNMGTIIRTADWFGIQNIFITEGCVDVYNSKTVQATMASLARVKIFETDLKNIFENNKDIPVYGAVLDGKSIFEIQHKEKGILLIGNEGRGISDALQSYITHKITIPGSGRAESLNAAISAGIISAWACEG